MTSQIQDLAISDLNSIPLTNTISFDYLRPTDVKVQVGTTLSNLAEKTYITHWTITNDKKIQFETSVFTATGTYKVRIYRVTDASSPTHVFNAGSSIRSQDLNDISKQTLFVADEVRDTVNSLSTDGSGVSNVIIDGSNIADNSITTSKILDLEVTTSDLSNGAVTTPKIGDTQVTDTKLANDAVTTRAIKDGEITRPKIAPANITDVELSVTGTSTGQFTAADITVNDQGRITAAANGTIGTTEIENGAVTLDKLSAATQIAIAPPVGCVFWFATHTAPAGYLECNGDAIPNGTGTVQGKTADFSALYGVIGGFLPHISDEHFIRGHGGAAAMRTRDAQRFKSFTLLSQQVSGNNYTHQAYMGKSTTQFLPSNSPGDLGKWTAGNSGSNWIYRLKWDTTETRPKSIALLPIIKF